MTQRFERLVLALILALLAAGVTLVFAHAQEGTPTSPPENMSYNDCASCHQDINDSWLKGDHGQAFSDPVFVEAWNSQGKPGACLVCHTTGYDPATGKSNAEAVSCEACHSPIPADHPNDNMPVDKSPELCGQCHSDPRFATENWQLSAHYQRDMTCSVCHDSHTASMKTIQGEINTADASGLCANCHKDAMNNFPTSKHAEAGVTCVNCHLSYNVDNANGTRSEGIGEAHKAPDHSFLPSLETCNKCHASQMHAPGEAVAAAAIKIENLGGTPTAEPSPVSPTLAVASVPTPVSPIGYAGLAALIGLAGGVVLAPWLENWYRIVVKRTEAEEEKHD